MMLVLVLTRVLTISSCPRGLVDWPARQQRPSAKHFLESGRQVLFCCYKPPIDLCRLYFEYLLHYIRSTVRFCLTESRDENKQWKTSFFLSGCCCLEHVIYKNNIYITIITTIIYLESITSGKVALTPEPRAHVDNAWLYKNNYSKLYTILYYNLLYCTVLYCTVLYCTVLYCTVLYCTVLYCTVLYCTVLYCTVLYCTVLYCTVLYCTVLYCTVLYCTVLYCTVLYCTVLYCTVLYCTVLYCTVLYCTVLYCTVLYCTVLYCTVLYCTVLLYKFEKKSRRSARDGGGWTKTIYKMRIDTLKTMLIKITKKWYDNA